MEEMLAVVIYYLDGLEFYAVYVIQEIQQRILIQHTFAMIVVEDFKNLT